MKKKLSIRNYSKGIWFFKKKIIQIQGGLEPVELQLFIEELLSFLSDIVPVYGKPLNESDIIAGYRGKTQAVSKNTNIKDQSLVIEGVLSDDETYKERDELSAYPFRIETNAVFNGNDNSRKSVLYKFSSNCNSEFKELLGSESVYDIARNPVVRLSRLDLDLEKFSLDGVISQWSGIPTVHETLECNIKNYNVHIRIASDSGLNPDKRFFEKAVFSVLSKYIEE